MLHLSSSVLDILKSLLNLNRGRCYKVRYIATDWQHCVLKSLKLVTLSDLQGESQVYVFHLLVEVGFLPFYEHIDFLSFTWYLVAAESSIWKQSNLQDVRQDSELCRWGLEKCRLVSPT